MEKRSKNNACQTEPKYARLESKKCLTSMYFCSVNRMLPMKSGCLVNPQASTEDKCCHPCLAFCSVHCFLVSWI